MCLPQSSCACPLPFPTSLLLHPPGTLLRFRPAQLLTSQLLTPPLASFYQLPELSEAQKEFIAKAAASKEAAAVEDVEARGPTSFFHGKESSDYQVRRTPLHPSTPSPRPAAEIETRWCLSVLSVCVCVSWGMAANRGCVKE